MLSASRPLSATEEEEEESGCGLEEERCELIQEPALQTVNHQNVVLQTVKVIQLKDTVRGFPPHMPYVR